MMRTGAAPDWDPGTFIDAGLGRNPSTVSPRSGELQERPNLAGY